jgi:CubicO group peptidase (beta-lactamase class C family)
MEKVVQVIDRYRKEQKFNGVIWIRGTKGELLSEKIGSPDILRNIPFTIDTQFQIASISKQFTAVAVLSLMDKNRIEINQPIIRYLPPHHPIWKNHVPDWAKVITVHHLLTHSSGLANYSIINWDSLDLVPNSEVYPTLIEWVNHQPIRFSPGERIEYSNTGYLLLSLIADEVSPQRDLGAFLKQEVFVPLQMHNTSMPNLVMERNLIERVNQNSDLPGRYTLDLENLMDSPIPFNKGYLRAPLRGSGSMISSAKESGDFKRIT